MQQLEWREYLGTLEVPPSRLVTRPQAFRTRREWTSLVVSTLALFDVCYLLRVGGTDAEGSPLGLWPLDPTLIAPASYDYYSLLPPQEFFIGQERISRDELVVLNRSPQPTITEGMAGVLNMARASFAAAISAERYASRYWQAGGAPLTYLKTAASLSDAEADQVSDRWAERRRRGPDYAPVLSGGLEADQFGADPTQQAAVDARREMVADVGRYFGIPTALLNAPAGDSETYATTEQQGIHLARYTLENYMGAIEDGISDVLPPGHTMRMDDWPLTAGTLLTRAQAYQLATGGEAWMDAADVRDREGLAPREITPSPSARPTPVAIGGTPNGE